MRLICPVSLCTPHTAVTTGATAPTVQSQRGPERSSVLGNGQPWHGATAPASTPANDAKPTHPGATCTYCAKRGHIAEVCNTRKAAEALKGVALSAIAF
mmetsp:Transcript_12708/g.22473  ORF Transcript_12708/g.22473 Transcript_12708/m.22473 type:complete len:99 (+) Transcript_12708:80-376(+)